MINMPCEIVSWNGLPCLIDGDKAVLFSYIGNSLIASLVKTCDLSSLDLEKLAEEKHLFDCLSVSNTPKDVPVKQVTLCLTERCNCRCRYCFLDANTSGFVMSEQTARNAIDYAFNAFRNHTIVLSAFGGEPGTQEGLIRFFVKYAKERAPKYNVNVLFAITTNGVIQDTLVDFLIQNNFVCTISADGIEEVQNYQRPLANGKGTYERVIKTIEALTCHSIEVKIRSTITKFSLPKMVDSVKLYGQLGVSQIHFEPVTIAGRAISVEEDLQQPSPKEYAQQLILCIKEAAKYHTKINFSFCSRCTGSLKNKMIVGANGLISSCVEVQNEKHEFASLFKMGQLNQDGSITLSSHHLSYLPSNNSKEECQICPYRIFCNNSCPIRNYRATGNYSITEPYKCELFKEIIPYILQNMYFNTFN